MTKKRSFLLVLLSLIAGLAMAAGALAAPLGSVAEPDGPDVVGSTEGDITEPLSGGRYMELTAQYGGSAQAVDVVGDRAYVSQGQRLLVYDVADPAHPQLLGQSTILNNEARRIAAAGNYVFMVSPSLMVNFNDIGSGLRVMDVSNPSKPVEVYFEERINNNYQDLALRDQRVYVAENKTGLEVWNVENPTQPIRERNFFIDHGASRISLYSPDTGSYAGRLLALTGNSEGVTLVDVTDIAQIKVVASLADYYIEDLAVHGSNAYIFLWDKVVIVDLSNPEAPFEKGSIPGTFYNATFADHFLYLDNVIFDVADAAKPVEVGRWDATIALFDMDLAEIGGQRYNFIASGQYGLTAVRVSPPEAPEVVGGDDRATNTFWVKQVGNLAYTSDLVNNTLDGVFQIYDVSSPNNLRLLSTTPVTGSLELVENGIAYLNQGRAWGADGSRYGGGLKLVKVSDPYHPVPAGFYDSPVSPNAIALQAPYAYVIDRNSLRVVDVSDPDHLVETAAYTTTMYASDIAVGKSSTNPSRLYAYMVSTYEKVQLDILDITDPTNIQPAGVLPFETPDKLTSIALYKSADNKLYALVGGNGNSLLGGSGSLTLIDITDPAHPAIVETKTLNYEVRDIQIRGERIYVSAGYAGVNVYDFSTDPAGLTLVGNYLLPSYIVSADGSGAFVLAASGTGGLFNTWIATYGQTLISGSGVLSSPADWVEYVFPTGTFTTETRVYHQSRYWGNMSVPSTHVALERFFWNLFYDPSSGDSVPPTQPYTVTIGYGDLNLGSLDESTLALYRWDGTQWLPEPSSRVDVETKTMIANPVTEGTWGLMAPRPAGTILFLPLTRR